MATSTQASTEAARAKMFARTLKLMKKAVLEVQLLLLDGVDTDAQFHAARDILALSEYADVVTERSIAKICGYSRCANALTTENTRKGRYRISLSAKKVYDLQEASQFCSPAHLIASKEFASKLPVERDPVEASARVVETLALVRGSQYARSKSPKPKSAKKSTLPLKNVKRGRASVHPADGATSSSSISRSGSSVRDNDARGNMDTTVSSSNYTGARSLPSRIGERGNNDPSMLDSLSFRGPYAGRNNHGDVATSSSNSEIANSSVIFSGSDERDADIPSISNPPSINGALGSLIGLDSDLSTDSSDLKSTGSVNLPHGSSTKRKPVKLGDTIASSSNSSSNVSLSQKGTSSTSSGSSSSLKNLEKTFLTLTIQENMGDEKFLPILDYGGPSDSVEGYVPSRFRRGTFSRTGIGSKDKVSEVEENSSNGGLLLRSSDQKLQISGKTNEEQEGVSNISRDMGNIEKKQVRSQGSGENVFEEWEGLVSGNPLTSSAAMCTDIDNAYSVSSSVSTSSNVINTDVKDCPIDLKPALRMQPGGHKVTHSVSWADQNVGQMESIMSKLAISEELASPSASATLNISRGEVSEDSSLVEDKTYSVNQDVEKQSENEIPESTWDIAKAARLASAEAIAAALTEAATAAATGELEGSEAVARAGISILSATHNSNNVSMEEEDTHIDVPEDFEGEPSEDELYARAAKAREYMRRPKMRSGSDEDEDEDDGDGDGDDDDDDIEDDGGFEGACEVGFKAPPKGFKAEVSMFGTMFMALERWISAGAVAHVYGKEPHEADDFLSVNGREYCRQFIIGGVSAEIMHTFSQCVSRALPEVVRATRISVPISTLEQSMGRLVKTMSFIEALPPFGTKHWRMVVILMLDALSVQRLPWLGAHLLNNRALFKKVLESTGTSEAEYDVFRDVILPMGRSPTFSTLSGG